MRNIKDCLSPQIRGRPLPREDRPGVAVVEGRRQQVRHDVREEAGLADD